MSANTYAIDDANPKSAELVRTQDLGCVSLSNFRLGLVITNDRLGVSPSANEDLSDWVCFIRFTGQSQVSIVWCTHSELANTIMEWIVMVFQSIGCV